MMYFIDRRKFCLYLHSGEIFLQAKERSHLAGKPRTNLIESIN